MWPNPGKERQRNLYSIINKGKYRLSLVAYSGIVLFFVGILVSPISRHMFTLALIGFGLTFVPVVYAFLPFPAPDVRRRGENGRSPNFQ
jgi:hypothetical protein